MAREPGIAGRLAAARDAYPEQSRERLRGAGVRILPVDDIPHMTLVDRAVGRRRPCNDKGDGYRDTLNWLTLLNLAGRHAGRPIRFVTTNTRDFQGDTPGTLHEHLVEDMRAIGAEDLATVGARGDTFATGIERKSGRRVARRLRAAGRRGGHPGVRKDGGLGPGRSTPG